MLSNQIQTNVIKTMIFVSAFFAIAWLPNYTFILLLNLSPNLKLSQSGYNASVFIAFLYICTNPFIYAAKFDPVRQVLIRMVLCKKTAEPASVVNVGAPASVVTTRGPHVPAPVT